MTVIGRLGIASLLLTLAVSPACIPQRGRATPTPADSGTLYVYLDAPPKDAPRLDVAIASLEALDDAGTLHGLEIREGAITARGDSRQRLLASGRLPPGRYSGLRFAIASARVEREGGLEALATEAEPGFIERGFSVDVDGAATLLLRLEPDASIADGSRFEPSFTLGTPGVLAGGLYALAVSRSDSALVLFHKLTGEVFGVLRTDPDPVGIALDVERRLAFVASSGRDVLDAFDLVRMARDQRFPVLAGDEPSALALTRDGRTLACVHRGSSVLGIYDAPVLAERFRVPVGLEPSAVVIDDAGLHAYVVNTGSDSITAIDLEAGKARRTVATEDGPVYAALDRAGRRLYVVHRDSPYLLAVALPQLTVDRRVYVGSGGRAIAVDPRTDRIFIGRRDTGGIEVFDPGSLLAVDRIDVGGDVAFLSVSRDGDLLYAAVPRSREVVAIRLAGYRAVATTDLAGSPVWIAPAGER